MVTYAIAGPFSDVDAHKHPGIFIVNVNSSLSIVIA